MVKTLVVFDDDDDDDDAVVVGDDDDNSSPSVDAEPLGSTTGGGCGLRRCTNVAGSIQTPLGAKVNCSKVSGGCDDDDDDDDDSA